MTVTRKFASLRNRQVSGQRMHITEREKGFLLLLVILRSPLQAPAKSPSPACIPAWRTKWNYIETHLVKAIISKLQTCYKLLRSTSKHLHKVFKEKEQSFELQEMQHIRESKTLRLLATRPGHTEAHKLVKLAKYGSIYARGTQKTFYVQEIKVASCRPPRRASKHLQRTTKKR